VAQLEKDIVELIGSVCTTTEPDLSNLDRPLLESGLDSLDYVSALMAIEDKYDFDGKGLSFSSVEMEDIQTVNAIATFMVSNNITG
jgi:acyl carrier protein